MVPIGSDETQSSNCGRVSLASETWHPERVWRLHAEAPAGVLVSTSLRPVSYLRNGEWLQGRDGTVIERRRRAWSDDYFSWRVSRQARPASGCRWRTRIYLNPSDPESARDEIADTCDSRALWFECKVAPEPRLDRLVFWVASEQLSEFSGIAETYTTASDPLPPAALQRRGLGLVHDPDDGGSFGALLSTLLMRAKQTATWNELDLENQCRSVLLEAGLDPERPWRHPGVDPFGSWNHAEAK